MLLILTGTRYDLETLHQCGKRVTNKSQEVSVATSYVCRSNRKKTGRLRPITLGPITLAGDILYLQLIYGGNTLQRLQRFKSPEYFPLSVNLKHFSNTEEPIKVINEIVLLYVDKKKRKIG